MGARLFLVCAASLLVSTSGGAQQTDPSRIRARTVTLISLTQHKEHQKSVFNFEYGVRGDERFPRQPVPDEPPDIRSSVDLPGSPSAGEMMREPALREVRRVDLSPRQRTNYDIRFRERYLKGDADWLTVVIYRGTRSVIKDLGEMSWSEVKHVPVLPASPASYDRGHSVVVRRSVVKISPENVAVKAIAGHIYLLHVKDEEADYYVLLRVEEVDPKGGCRISWKRVPSPEQ